jgi:hypothetical protein
LVVGFGDASTMTKRTENDLFYVCPWYRLCYFFLGLMEIQIFSLSFLPGSMKQIQRSFCSMSMM